MAPIAGVPWHASRFQRTTQVLLSALATLLAYVSPAAAQAPCAPAIEYGMNPSHQVWSSRAIVFADAFQRVRSMYYWNNGPQGIAPLLPAGVQGAGWPDPAMLAADQRYGSMLFGSMDGTIPDGRVSPYVVTWHGAGHVRLEGASVRSEQNRDANRVEVFVDPTIGRNALLSVSWTATDPADPVRDVHVWLPGTERSGGYFWPPFLARVRGMNLGRGPHSWRTLDWMRVNDYGRQVARGGFRFDRAGVIGPASPSQGTLRGVAPEYQVALCNAVGANLHITFPHRTHDLSESDYVEYLRDQLVRIRDGSPGVPGLYGGRRFAGLDPSLTVTVELSNEIWNSLFLVNAWMGAEATRKGISFTEQVASQVQILFDVAESVFSGADAPRLRTFVGGFIGGPNFVRNVLFYLRPGTQVDAIGPAAYLGPRRAEIDAWMIGSSAGCATCPDASELIDTAFDKVEVLRPLIAQHRTIAARWINPDGSSPALELYEGGINLKSSQRPWADAGRDAQTDPRLFELLVDRYVPMLVEEGVDVVNWYSFMSDQASPDQNAFGIWDDMGQTLTFPVVEPYSDEGAPKAAAVYMGPPLALHCPLASAVARHASGNFPCYTATPPVLGEAFRASVDLSASGDKRCILVASPLAAHVPLPSGQTLLCALNGAQFLPPRVGPIASWLLAVPRDPILAGARVTTQAFLLGGAPGVNLSNAMDLTLGR